MKNAYIIVMAIIAAMLLWYIGITAVDVLSEAPVHRAEVAVRI